MRQSFNESLLDYLTGDELRRESHSISLSRLLRAGDFAGLERLFRAFFASIPYEWHTRNEIARYEGYYASVFYSYFAGLGLEVAVEDSGSGGRLDMAVRAEGRVYLFEFKVLERAGPWGGDGAVEGTGLRGQVPPLGGAGASRGGGVQRRDTERGRRLRPSSPDRQGSGRAPCHRRWASDAAPAAAPARRFENGESSISGGHTLRRPAGVPARNSAWRCLPSCLRMLPMPTIAVRAPPLAASLCTVRGRLSPKST